MTNYETLKSGILSDPTTSNWLKDAVAKLDKRDPCDVIADIEMLNFLSNVRLQDLGISAGAKISLSSIQERLFNTAPVLGSGS
jgi:hypothetical protein